MSDRASHEPETTEIWMGHQPNWFGTKSIRPVCFFPSFASRPVLHFVDGLLVFQAVFSFLYLKKLKFQKYMSVLENFKNIPRSPSHRATGPKCNFFSSNLQRSPCKKKGGPVAPPTGDRGLSPTPGATGACRPLRGRQGPWGAHMACRLGDVCRAQATSQLWRGKCWQFSGWPGKQKNVGVTTDPWNLSLRSDCSCFCQVMICDGDWSLSLLDLHVSSSWGYCLDHKFYTQTPKFITLNVWTHT